jgi:hypothetical protein
VSARYTTDAVQYLRRIVVIGAVTLALAALAGCSSESQGGEPRDPLGALAAWAGFSTQSSGEAAVDNLRALADEKCHQGNQPACDTIVQIVGNKVAIESVGDIPALTPSCNAGHQDSCQTLGVLHAELSQWCSANNARACATVNVGPWPPKLDVPAAVDSAKLACLGGQLKPDSQTCRALENI